jgi:hypothetical protein
MEETFLPPPPASNYEKAPVGPRLAQCFEAGSVEDLFPLLCNWSPAELDALTEELNVYTESALVNAERRYQEYLKAHPEAKEDAVARAIHDNHTLQVQIVMSEIFSVVLYYQGLHDGRQEVVDEREVNKKPA